MAPPIPRVLMVTSSYPRWPGDATTPFVHDLAVDLLHRGWGVAVLAPHAPGARTREDLDGVEVHRFRYMVPERLETVCYGGGALINLRESRAAAAIVPAMVAAEWVALSRRLSGPVDLVHAHWALPQGFVAATTPWPRIPRVLTVHGSDVNRLRGRLVDRFTRYAFRHVDLVTVNSSATERTVRELAGPAADLELIPMGVDTSRPARPDLVEEIRSRYRSPEGPLLVFVGRLVEEKGVEDVVRAAALLQPRFAGVTAVLAGAGQHRARLEQLVKELGLEGRVHLPGWIDPGDVTSWFSAGDVVLAPSWDEGQGLSIIEAMAAGAVVVATRTGGIPDSVADGESGRLVPPADPPALARAVTDVLEDPERGAGMAAQARRRAARFDRHATAERFGAAYARLIGRGPGPI